MCGIYWSDFDHGSNTFSVNKRMRAFEFIISEKTDPKLCRSPKRLGRSDYSSCVSQGLRPHQSKGKGHTDGHGHYLKGRKAKSIHYGGAVKDYDGK
jgi:hypothetical protein